MKDHFSQIVKQERREYWQKRQEGSIRGKQSVLGGLRQLACLGGQAATGHRFHLFA